MSAWKNDQAMEPAAWEPEQPDERDYEPGLPLQYEGEPEEYGVMDTDLHGPLADLQARHDTLLANIDMAAKCIKERAAMELRASKKAVEEGDCTFTLMCLHEHLGLLFALDILIDRGVWHDQEATP